MLLTSAAVTRVRREGEIEEDAKLRRMLDMPLDVIFEICSCLHPVDLLYLSRTSKDLRQTLMSRQARGVWRAVLDNLWSLPPCPDDLSEPAYVSLIFDQHCHLCLDENGHNMHWQCRMRLCNRCLRENEVDEYELRNHEDMLKFRHVELTDVIPARPLFDYDDVEYRYYTPAVRKLASTVSQIPVHEHAAFLKKIRKLVASRAEGGWGMFEYLEHLREDRSESIIAQLQEAGYQDEVDLIVDGKHYLEYGDFDALPGVSGVKPLSSGAWDAMKTQLLEHMQDVREKHLAEIRRDTLRDRLVELLDVVERLVPGSPYRSRPILFLEIALRIPIVTQLLNPDAKEFDPEELEGVLCKNATLSRYLETRDEHNRDAFRRLLRSELALDSAVDPLELAVAMWFPHRNLKSVLFNFRLLSADQAIRDVQTAPYLLHPTEGLSRKDCEFIRETAFELLVPYLQRTDKWIHGPDLKDAAAIIEFFGLDPRTATIQAMDNACGEIRFVCTCHGTMAIVLGWRATLHHIWRCHRGKSHPIVRGLRRAMAAEISVSKPLEDTAEMLERIAFEKNKHLHSYECAYCSMSGVPRDDITAHLKIRHKIVDPINSDYVHASTIVRPPPSVYLIRTSDQSKLAKKYLEEGIGALFDFAEV